MPFGSSKRSITGDSTKFFAGYPNISSDWDLANLIDAE